MQYSNIYLSELCISYVLVVQKSLTFPMISFQLALGVLVIQVDLEDQGGRAGRVDQANQVGQIGSSIPDGFAMKRFVPADWCTREVTAQNN